MKVYCPSCGDPATEAGAGKIFCEQCDTEFAVSQTKGAKAVKTGVLDDHNRRLTAIERVIFDKAKSKPEPDPDSVPDDESEDDDQEEDILPG